MQHVLGSFNCSRLLWFVFAFDTYGGHACAVFDNEVKVLVVGGMEVNREPVQYGDRASELKQVKCTNV
jgi:hypothetical protein